MSDGPTGTGVIRVLIVDDDALVRAGLRMMLAARTESRSSVRSPTAARSSARSTATAPT